jgi:DNA-binding NtrC family response regulator
MGHSQFILLVEDEAFIALMLQDLLESSGFAVVAVQGAREALDVLASRPTEIAALISDIRLGSTTSEGWALVHHARELNPRLPIVYLSGGGGEDHATMGVADSILLTKPFTATQFLGAVARLLDKPSACMVG